MKKIKAKKFVRGEFKSLQYSKLKKNRTKRSYKKRKRKNIISLKILLIRYFLKFIIILLLILYILKKNILIIINPSFQIWDSRYFQDLAKFSPIGCRDIYTRDKLIEHGIKAYFSSCLTSTLDIDYSAKEKERTNDIIFNLSKIIYIQHNFFFKNFTHIERFKFAKNLLYKYARAKLVITIRIHAALPCLALNTPFILVNKNFNKRFPGLYI